MGEYTAKKFSQLTSFGRDNLEVHAALRDDADIFEIYTLALGRETESMLRKYGKEIIGKQYVSKRLAEVAVDLFVGLSMLSRVNSLITSKGVENCKHELAIMRIFSRQARRRMNQQLRRVEKNEDPLMDELADYIFQEGKYTWDIL